MAAISLAKALKLKNRLASRLNKTQDDIITYNCVLEEQVGTIDVIALWKLRDEIVNYLIEIKSKIAIANNEIQVDLIRSGELKSKLSWMQGISTRDGKERHGYQNTEVVYVAALKKKDIDEETRRLEAEIDKIQDKLDNYNHTKKIEIADRALDLAS